MRVVKDIKILDLTQFLSGPFCTQILAGLGAEVIKIENPKGGASERYNTPFVGKDGVSSGRNEETDISISVLKRSRNKKSITLNLKSPEGRALFLKLAEKADVIMENYRPGVPEKLQISYEDIKKVNPGIIYCSLNGFGDIESYKNMPAFDIVVQALSGAMSVNGYPDTMPVRNGIAVSDLSAGLYSCIGILAAILHKNQTGEGQHVKVSMMESTMSFLMDETPEYWSSKGLPLRNGSRLTRLTPFNTFEASDGCYVIASGSDLHWKNILKAIGREDLENDERFITGSKRADNTYIVDEIINSWSCSLKVEEAVDILSAHGIPCAPVRDITEVCTDEILRDSKVLVPVMHPLYGSNTEYVATDNPIHFSKCQASFDKAAPVLGSNNLEIYADYLGLDQATIQSLKDTGVI